MTFGSGFLFSQKYVGLSVDNDLYFGIDRYYSSGIFLKYGKLKSTSQDTLQKTTYISEHWELGQEINTPRYSQTSDLSKIDYPYSGWLFLGYQKETFQHLNFGYGWGIQLGTTGSEASLAKFFQNTYHRYILNLDPLSWSFSIPQSFHLNLETSLYWGTKLKGKLKWVQENKIRVGTFRTALQTRFGLQWGAFKGLPFFGQRIEDLTNGFAFFAGTALTINVHDYSLTGSMFQSNSPFEFNSKLFRSSIEGGILFFQSPIIAKVFFHYSSALITTQQIKYHPYLNISLSNVF